MQLTIERDTFLKALSAALGAVDGKSEVPIFTHVLIGTDGEAGLIRGTDMDMEIAAPFAAQIVEPGSLAAPAKLLHDIVKRMPGKAQIGLSIVQGKLKLVCGNSRFQLAILDADDYPALSAKADRSCQFEIEADRLKAMLAGVRHAMANDESRHYLNGVHLHIAHGEMAQLKAVATNGHMLALQACEAPIQATPMPAIILPKRTVAEFLKALPASSEMVTLIVSERLITLELAQGWRLTSKLIDGVYPDYSRVIPSDNPYLAKLSADALAKALERVATLCDADHAGITLALEPGGPITITAERAGLGSGSDQAAAEITGKKAAIGFNQRYLAAILASLSGATIELHYNAAADPMLIRIDGSSDIVHVLMPMRVAAGAERLEEAA
jgi:DNA polymerase III subunit beta